MNWYDHNGWTTLVALVALGGAIWIGAIQNKINKAIHKIQDTVELYGSFFLVITKDDQGKITSTIPYIHIQNVGTRLIYLEKYIFNGRIYQCDNQILPSTYSQAQNNFYRIELPTNGETHVSLEVFYSDLDSREWSSLIFADLKGGSWDIKTLPRKESEYL